MKLFFKNKNLDLKIPAVMGILNVSPDSFFDGGKYTNEKSMLEQAEKMLREGAAIIDIGGVSTRPGARAVNEEDELKRIIPVIELVRKRFPSVIISADTFKAAVAERAAHAGADLINDISGGTLDAGMFAMVAKLKLPYVLSHIKGSPPTMQQNPQYENVIEEVKNYFLKKIEKLKSLKVRQIILDVGFGFGKNLEHNYTLLKNLAVFKELGLPILAGISRKSMLGKLLGTSPETSMNATTAANMIALMNGANILRVHDVKEAMEAIQIFTFTQKMNS